MRKDEVKNDLKNMIELLVKDLNTNNKNDMDNIIQEIKKCKLGIDDPEKFHSFVSYPLENYLNIIANELHETPTIKNSNKCNFIYSQYSFLKHNIEKLCIQREGRSCCADKSRSIIKMFLKYSLNGEIPDFNPDVEVYFFPKFGTYTDWMNFCDGLYELFYGKNNLYLIALNTLLTSEIRKYKHILHTWYIKLNTGEEINIGNTWDNDIKSPVDNEYFDLGDCYLICDHLLNKLGYKLHKDESMILDYYEVPKYQVDNIYYNSSEIMC